MTTTIPVQAATLAVLRWRGAKGGVVVDRFTPDGWFEGDVVEISEAGFMSEFEIKLSLSDFNRDAEKVIEWQGVRYSKTSLLSRHHVRGPSRFWYVGLFGMLVEKVPAWAGLVELLGRGNGSYRPFVRVPAPQLHSVRVPLAVREAALRSAHNRYHRLLAGGA